MKATFSFAAVVSVFFIIQFVHPQSTDMLILDASLVEQRPWTLLTSMLAHSGMLHFLHNMFGLILFGLLLENRIGASKLCIIFIVSGLISSGASLLFYERSLGASGAVFGLIGAVAVLMPLMVVYAYYMPMPMFLAAGLWAAADMLGLAIPSNIANAAHLAGLGCGIIIGLVLRGRKPLWNFRKKQAEIITNAELDNWERQYMRKQ